MRLILTAAVLSAIVLSAIFVSDRPLAAEDEPSLARSSSQGPVSVKSASNEDSTHESDSSADMSKRFNLPFKTAGGTQLWTDYTIRDGYRIQRNALTDHWRLLDTADVRRAWGSRSACQEELDRLCPQQAGGEKPRHFVVLLHGLMRTRHSMKPLETSLIEQDDTEVIRFSYASARGSIGDHAAALREVIEDLPPDAQLSFVGHSMGNIVVRHLIGDLQRDNDPKGVLARCRSMVMLGPPNQGAAIARRLAPTKLYGLVTGQGGLELGPQWDELIEKLATPPFPFMIIAGDVSGSPVQNPIVDGSSDFVVSVDEARLDGAESLETVPVLHSFLMSDPESMKLTVEFIAAERKK